MKSNKPVILPEHQSPGPGQPTATAPYNFVPLPEKVVTPVESELLPGHDRYDVERFTGYFDVNLKTMSPLYVRCALPIEDVVRVERYGEETDEFCKQLRNTPDFFYTQRKDRPIIPGTSLRGMLRSLMEIVSYGKMQWVREQPLVYRDVTRREYRERMANVKAGILRRRGQYGEYYMQPCLMLRASRAVIRRTYHSGNGQPPDSYPLWGVQHKRVWVRYAEKKHHSTVKGDGVVTALRWEEPNEPGWYEGRMVITGPAPLSRGDKREFVFVPREDADVLPVPDAVVQNFHDEFQISKWQQTAFPKDRPVKDSRSFPGWLSKHLHTEGEPIFYIEENGVVTAIGRAMMFRLIYNNTPLDLVPEELRRQDITDYAEALFGYIAKDADRRQQQAYAGRVTVSDAVLVDAQDESGEDKDIWLSDTPVVPQILSTPKPTSYNLYLTQRKGAKKNSLLDYDAKPSGRTVLRGHKLYWAKGDRSAADLVDDTDVKPDSTQHTQFRPVRSGVNFRFRVHFENLAPDELGALIWTLRPGGPEDPNASQPRHCHRLGMGKPLGMGVVHLQATLHLIDRQRRYTRLFDGVNWETGQSAPPESLDNPEVWARRTRPFEEHVLASLGQSGKKQLQQLPRIRKLLAMLSWPGPDPSSTGYMALSDFRVRPVLPDPLGVIGEVARTEAAAASEFAAERTPRRGNDTFTGLLKKRPLLQKAKEERVRAYFVRSNAKGKHWVRLDGEEGEVQCENIPPYPVPKPNDKLRVRVTRDGARVTRVRFYAWNWD